MHVFQELVLLPLVHHSQVCYTVENKKKIHLIFGVLCHPENLLVTLQERDTEKSQCLLITTFFKWETPATK